MILRKPYAFFIKHFKLFNIILTVLEIYVIYKLGFLLQFFFEYPSYPQGAVGQDLVGTLIQPLVFIICLVIILVSMLMFGILSLKKKPTKLYIYSIIVNISLLVLLFISYLTLSTIELQVIESRTAFAVRDFLIIGVVLQFINVAATCMRAIGFDIKSFSFGKDLEELNIDVSDNEEFELQIDIDSSKFQRNLNRNKRYFKYFIYENKFAIILISTIILGLGSYLIYSKMGIYFGATKVDKMIKVDNFSMGLESGYLTAKDYKGKTITNDNVIVAIPIKIKVNNTKEKINIARFKLIVDDNKYYHVTTYKDKLTDLGVTYNNQIITTDFSTYLLVFEIPIRYKNKKMYIQYDTLNEKNVTFKTSLENVDEDVETINNNLTEIVNFNNDIINKGTLVINSFEINDKFKIDYKFCIFDIDCYDSYEYIVPNYKSNYDKTILKIKGSINLEETNMNISDLYSFIDNYGSLVYTIDGKTKRQNISFVRVKPQKTSIKDTYYIEVLDEVKNAEYISFEFKIRNIVYVYRLK